jgi:hypothetical protein
MKHTYLRKTPKRVITVTQASDRKGRYALNVCQVTVGDKSWRVDWTDNTLKMEQLQDKLIAEGANPATVQAFRDIIHEEAYEDGLTSAQSD